MMVIQLFSSFLILLVTLFSKAYGFTVSGRPNTPSSSSPSSSSSSSSASIPPPSFLAATATPTKPKEAQPRKSVIVNWEWPQTQEERTRKQQQQQPQKQHQQQQQQQQQYNGGVHEIGSVQDYIDIIDGNYFNEVEKNQLVIVKYYANYCRICHRAGLKYKKIAVTKNPGNKIMFAKIEVGGSGIKPVSSSKKIKSNIQKRRSNNNSDAARSSSILSPETLRSIGVDKFPFLQIYRNGKCVASFSSGPIHLFEKNLVTTINNCSDRNEEQWEQFLTEFDEPIQSNVNAINAIREQAREEKQQEQKHQQKLQEQLEEAIINGAFS